jgi:hypothetical protein
MAYQSPYKNFIFEGYSFDENTGLAEFKYSFDGVHNFTETLQLSVDLKANSINTDALDGALQLAFYTVGTSYYKAFPTKNTVFKVAEPNEWQAEFLKKLYHEGLSQFYFENNISIEELPVFKCADKKVAAVSYVGEGSVVLQSGGKDSLLLATLLEQKNVEFSPWYIQYSDSYPEVLNQLGRPLQTVRRTLDIPALKSAAEQGALNGHVPVTYIVLSYALIDAIWQGKNTVLAAIGSEGAEAHAYIGDMPVNHQWAKTWEAEQLFAKYVHDYVSPDLQVGSPLRGFSELRIAELFVEKCWEKYGHAFSSCNRANYQQGTDNTKLKWCGECPKCANSYLLFAPFVAPEELQSLFNGKDLFAESSLIETFKGLLGIDGVMKPFECVGEVDELRLAYHMAQKLYDYKFPFNVSESDFDYKKIQAHNQAIAL